MVRTCFKFNICEVETTSDRACRLEKIETTLHGRQEKRLPFLIFTCVLILPLAFSSLFCTFPHTVAKLWIHQRDFQTTFAKGCT